MENYEIKIWDILKILYRKKAIILGLLVIAVLGSFFFTTQMIDKQYKTEMWLRINQAYFQNQKEIPLEYVKSYFFYPEVLKVVTNNLPGLETPAAKISFRTVNGLIQVTYVDTLTKGTSPLLQTWAASAKLKLIEDESKRTVQEVREMITSSRSQLTREESKLQGLQALLAKGSQYSGLTNIPGNALNGKIIVVPELDAGYSELAVQASDTQAMVIELQNKAAFMEEILSEYKDALNKVRHAMTSSESQTDELFNYLSSIRTKYKAYLSQKDDKDATDVPVQPFDVVSEPRFFNGAVSPNVKLNVLIAGFLGLCAGILLALVLEYIKVVSVKSKTINV